MSLNLSVKMFSCPRALVTYRVLLAIVGGYAVSAALSLIVAQFSSAEGRELRSLIYLVFFVFYTVAIIWVFALNGHKRAWVATLGANVLAWSLLWLLQEWL